MNDPPSEHQANLYAELDIRFIEVNAAGETADRVVPATSCTQDVHGLSHQWARSAGEVTPSHHSDTHLECHAFEAFSTLNRDSHSRHAACYSRARQSQTTHSFSSPSRMRAGEEFRGEQPRSVPSLFHPIPDFRDRAKFEWRVRQPS
jgi:hypothetical protein